MIRVAIAFEFPTLNGGEHSMLATIEQLSGDQFEFIAIAPPSGRLATALADRSIEHVPLEMRAETGHRLPPDQASEKLLQAVVRTRPHVLHANSLSMARLTGAIAARLSIPAIGHLRDIVSLSHAAMTDVNQNILLLAVSEATRGYHVSQGLDPDRSEVLYNGVDCRRFQPREQTGFLREELGIPDSAVIALAVGQIGLRKALDVTADAAVLLSDRNPPIHLVLAGERYSSKAESVTFEQNVHRMFADAGLGERLHTPGYRSDVNRLMNEADLLVHAARQEPLGRVLLEAAASGLPIIATDVGGTREILCDGRSARLIPPDNPQQLAAAMDEMAADGGLRKSLAHRARQDVVRSFSIRTAAENMANIWKRVAEQPAD